MLLLFRYGHYFYLYSFEMAKMAHFAIYFIGPEDQAKNYLAEIRTEVPWKHLYQFLGPVNSVKTFGRDNLTGGGRIGLEPQIVESCQEA